MTDFRSDNTHGVHPSILEALSAQAGGTVSSYGEDPVTARLTERCRSVFETDVEIVALATGTAGNALTIAAMTPAWGAVFCHSDAHIYRDEMGAPEFFSGGAKVVPIQGEGGTLEPSDVGTAIEEVRREGRMVTPACVSITQATEAGTVYTAGEIRALCEVAHAAGCRVHMDGARFANAVVSTGSAPADLTWRAGVDALVFGATKNGAIAAELIVLFDRSLAEELTIRLHRAGHRFSKMRFLSTQLDAYLAEELWLRNARHANAMAARLASGLRTEILRPVEANIVFTRFPEPLAASLREQGFRFYDWPLFGPEAVRLVTGFSSSEDDVDGLVKAISEF